jgi:copper chaperone CopZ
MLTKERLAIQGMSCSHCVARVRSALEELDGVEVESVEIGEAAIRVDPERSSRDRAEQAVRDAGFDTA